VWEVVDPLCADNVEDVIEIAVADVDVRVELELVVLAATAPVFDTSPIIVISEGDPISSA
jgi:hypothetical protein